MAQGLGKALGQLNPLDTKELVSIEVKVVLIDFFLNRNSQPNSMIII